MIHPLEIYDRRLDRLHAAQKSVKGGALRCSPQIDIQPRPDFCLLSLQAFFALSTKKQRSTMVKVIPLPVLVAGNKRSIVRLSRRADSILLVSIGLCLFLLYGASFLAVGSFHEGETRSEEIGVGLLRPRSPLPHSRKHRLDEQRHASPCQPSNIHLSPANNVDLTMTRRHNVSMTVSFTLPDFPECSKSAVTPLVVYGRHESLSSSATPTTSTTFSESTVPSESFQFQYSNYLRTFQSSWIHHAVLEDLEGGAELYWYQIRVVENKLDRAENDKHDDGTNVAVGSSFYDVASRASYIFNSTVFNFTTPPLPSDSVRIALIADWGGSKEAIRTMNSILSRTKQHTAEITTPPISAVMIAGDITYANSHLPSWEAWLNDMEPLYSSTPLLVAAGNHEIECNRHNFHVFQAYESYFRVPNRMSANSHPTHLEPIPRQLQDCTHPAEFMTKYWYGNSFYSYRHGLLQIIVLNSYTDTTRGSVQYEWLTQELETNFDRAVTPWLLVVMHCPFHTTFRGHNGTYLYFMHSSCHSRHPRCQFVSMRGVSASLDHHLTSFIIICYFCSRRRESSTHDGRYGTSICPASSQSRVVGS
jgi:hypothetical protein